MTKEFNAKDYERVKNNVKKMFREEKLGSQQSYLDQTKLFQPITDTTREVTKNLENKIISDRESFNTMVVPMVTELTRANDQREALLQLPYYSTEVPESSTIQTSTPKRKDVIIDLDQDFNETDRENLQDLSLPLPSEVYQSNELDKYLAEATTQIRSLAQFTGKRSKKSDIEKEKYESQKNTVTKYKQRLKGIIDAGKLPRVTGTGLKKKFVRQKRKRGRPKSSKSIVYKDGDDLTEKLGEYVAAYKAGNNGVEETIQDILDELLNIKAINKNEYDQIYKNLFIKI